MARSSLVALSLLLAACSDGSTSVPTFSLSCPETMLVGEEAQLTLNTNQQVPVKWTLEGGDAAFLQGDAEVIGVAADHDEGPYSVTLRARGAGRAHIMATPTHESAEPQRCVITICVDADSCDTTVTPGDWNVTIVADPATDPLTTYSHLTLTAQTSGEPPAQLGYEWQISGGVEMHFDSIDAPQQKLFLCGAGDASWRLTVWDATDASNGKLARHTLTIVPTIFTVDRCPVETLVPLLFDGATEVGGSAVTGWSWTVIETDSAGSEINSATDSQQSWSYSASDAAANLWVQLVVTLASGGTETVEVDFEVLR